MSQIYITEAATPLVLGNRQYAPVTNGKSLSLPEQTGYISIINVDTLELLFIIQVYETAPKQRTDTAIEQITTMTHDTAKNRIIMTTSSDAKYALDLKGLSVSQLNDE